MFNNIGEAIEYARMTGNTTVIEEYLKYHLAYTSKDVAELFQKHSNGDAMYFLIAFLTTFLEGQKSVMDEKQLEIIDWIQSTFSMTVVKMDLPIGFSPNEQGSDVS